MNKLLSSLAILGTLTCAGTAYANAYHAEVEATAGFDQPQHGHAGSEYGVHAAYFLKQVDIHGVPLAETAYLDRASSISAHAHFANRGETDDATYGVAAQVYVPNSKIYASAGFSQSREKEREHGIRRDLDTTYYNAEMGYSPVQGLLVAAGVKGYENKEQHGVNPTLRAKYVTQVAGKFINLEAETSFGKLQEVRVAADYYINEGWSVGADFNHNDVEDSAEVGIKTRKFFTSQFSLEGRVGFGQEFDNNYTAFDLAARYHF